MNKPRIGVLRAAGATNSKVSILTTKIPCRSCQLENFCSSIDGDLVLSNQLNKVAEHSHPLRRGGHLFYQGDKFQNLYVVRTGGIKLYMTTVDGTEQVLNFYFPGELLSLDSIESKYHKTSAVALDTTSVCRLPYSRIKKLCKQRPETYRQLFKFAGQEIANEHNMLLTLGRKPAEERFATFLIDIAKRHRNSRYSHDDKLQLFMSRHDIANYLCLADETISRLFTKFSVEGILRTSRKSLQILDFSRLEAIANVHQIESLRAAN